MGVEMKIDSTGLLKEDSSRIATNLRTLLIIEAVAASDEPLSPTEINKWVGLPKQSIHRLCQTLIDEGFLLRDHSGKKLIPSPRTMKLAQGLLGSRHHSLARRQVLMRLSSATRETVNYVLPEIDGMTYLDRVETDWIFRVELPIGSRVPFHCTASGKVYLASLSNRNLEKVLSTITYEARTPNTIVSSDRLRREIETVRQNGYAMDHQELFEGMVALAVPIKDASGRFVAAVAFHGPTQRLTPEIMLGHLETLQEGAAQLAALNA